ncbi:MAG TPA: hypothetical protein VLC73_01400 [Burkholderiales bacterium]|nr:hypothetical protein [Burkholderiales bacterium]
MNRVVLLSLLALLPSIECAALEGGTMPESAAQGGSPIGIAGTTTAGGGGKVAFDQPALWYGDARGSGETGQSPALSSENWRLLLDERGIQYVDLAGNQPREILRIPYDQIAAVRTDPSERSHPVLIIDLIDGADGQPRSHVFMIMHAGSPTAPSAAMQAKILIEDSKHQGPADLAQAAPSQLEETVPGEEPRALDGVREERIAISAVSWQPEIEVQEASRPVSQGTGRIRRWAANGAKVPASLLQGCAQAGCHPSLFVTFLGVTALAAAGGAIAALGTNLVQGDVEAVSGPAALSAEAAQAAVSTIRIAAGDSITQPGFQQCVLQQLAPEGREAPSIRWSSGQRAASFSRFGGAGSVTRDQGDAYASVARNEHRYVIETFLAKVVLIPEGPAGRDESDPLLRVVVEGGFRLFDLEGGQPLELTREVRAEHRTLSGWTASEGAALREALRTACGELATWTVASAEDSWRNR